MSAYEWTATDEVYYGDAILSECTMGLFYDTLQFEKTNEGWHALLLQWDTEEDALTMVMVDEKVVDTADEALDWCEDRDRAKARERASNPEEGDDAEYWEMVLSGEFDVD